MRYQATFDSIRPHMGVVVDEEQGRYCTFPSVAKTQDAAGRWNQQPLIEHDPPMIWRSTADGRRLP